MKDTLIFQLDQDGLDQIKKVQSKYTNNGLVYGQKADNNKTYDQGHWSKKILNNSMRLHFDHGQMPYIERAPEIKNLWEKMQNVIGKRSLHRVYINGYTFGTEGYAHTDEIWFSENLGTDSLGETVLIYLNEKWDIDWAGETVIFDQNLEIEKSVLPKYGRVLIFDSNKLHAARPVSRAFTGLRSVLVFKSVDPKVDSPQVNYILEKTKGYNHKNRTLLEHLFNTTIILEHFYDQPKKIMLAGLFHAVYGTTDYEFPALDRSEVRDQIGEYPEYLVWEFSKIKDRFNTLINNTANYSEEIRKDLLIIEMANLRDQNQNNEHQSKIDQIRKLYFK